MGKAQSKVGAQNVVSKCAVGRGCWKLDVAQREEKGTNTAIMTKGLRHAGHLALSPQGIPDLRGR